MDSREFIVVLVSIGVVGAVVITLIRTVAQAAARRSRGPQEEGAVLMRVDDRLGRMEQAIDAMAIEVERISEGQRFTAKLLAERAPEASRLPR
ncbi:MAG: hypothetical protein IT360_04735 [Gemmatimonadaceae bacterium]|nr:hypothetical protein [Gemmatimonadaceae bacterium]